MLVPFLKQCLLSAVPNSDGCSTVYRVRCTESVDLSFCLVGVRPVVHWSESQAGRKPHAHSDFVSGPLRLYGLEGEVDVMIESKAKELALQKLRDPNFVPSAAALATAITDE